jgi:predicted PurR-regulated permease PerM
MISVGFTSIVPALGGVLMLACAAGVLYLALTTGGVLVVVLGLVTVALSVAAGVASLITARAKPIVAVHAGAANQPAQ